MAARWYVSCIRLRCVLKYNHHQTLESLWCLVTNLDGCTWYHVTMFTVRNGGSHLSLVGLSILLCTLKEWLDDGWHVITVASVHTYGVHYIVEV